MSSDIGIKNKKVSGVFLNGGEFVLCNSLVFTTGTFLRGMIRIGKSKKFAGTVGDKK